MCLNAGRAYIHPTALAMVVNVFAIPAVAFLFWIVLWTVNVMCRRVNRPLHLLAKRCLLSLMVLWYITFVPVLKSVLSVGLCIDVHDVDDFEDESTTMYWAVDTSVKCYEGDHSKLLYYLVLSFVCPVYGGLLVLFVVFLQRPAERLVQKNGWTYETMGFLYRSYRLGPRRYWEVAVVVRKAVVAFLVFCAHLYNSVVPVTGVAHFITFAIVAQILAMPYRESFKDLNRFEVSSLFVSLVTTQAAIMLREDGFPDNYSRELVTTACLLLNLVAFFVFAYYILKFATEYFKRALAERDDDCETNAGVFGVLVHWMRSEWRKAMEKLRPNAVAAQNNEVELPAA